MAGEAGMSIKERLAMLQANNKNPSLAGPMKAGPAVPQKTTVAVNKAPPSSDSNNKANGPATTPGRPIGALKPALKPPTNDAGDAKKDEDKPHVAFKLRPTGTQLDGKGGTPVVPLKPTGGTTTPFAPHKTDDSQKPTPPVPKKPDTGSTSHEPAGTTASITILRDKTNASTSPRPPSIQERMAALRVKSGDGAVEAGPKSPADSSQKKFPALPNKASVVGVPKDGAAPVKPTDLAKSILEAANRVRAGKKGGEVFLRHSDGKRFHKIDAATLVDPDVIPPPKPAVIDDVDLATFLHEYATAKENKLSADAAKGEGGAEAGEGEMEELYVEAESTSVQLRVRGRGSVKRATSVRVSEIPEFTEEEEEEELYNDAQSSSAGAKFPEAPEEEYDDCASVAAAVQNHQPPEVTEFEEPDEIYEPLDEDLGTQEPEPVSSPPPTDDKKAKKEKEKEKDNKEAKKKEKEEKERKKKEEEVKKQRRKFGLKDTDDKVGEGVVKNNASGGVFAKDQLAVSKGEMVSILRMDNNPAGKWLVQNEQGKLGYVSSNNIEVATPAIRQSFVSYPKHRLLHMGMMSGMAPALPGDDEDPEEMYEALPEGEMDEIYEEL